MKLFTHNCLLRTLITVAITSVAAVGADAATTYYTDSNTGMYFSVKDGKATIAKKSYTFTGNVVIPSTVTSGGTTYTVTGIAASTFNKNTDITSIKIPSTITSIGTSAFSGASNLEAVYIEDLTAWCNINFSSTSSSPFKNSKETVITTLYVDGVAVTDLTIPTGVTTISKYAFYNYGKLKSVTIPSGVTEIGNSAFYNNTELTSITIPSTVTTIGSSAFSQATNITAVYITDLKAWCNINFGTSSNPLSLNEDVTLYLNNNAVTGNLTIPDNVTTIGNYAFNKYTKLTSVTIPSTVTSIGNYAFQNCGLKTVTLEEGVTSIGTSAFSACDIESIAIPNSVTTINSSAFSNCTSLTSVTLPKNDSFTTINGFSGCTALVSITIPENVTSIGNSAFSGCTAFTSFIIPETVTSVGQMAFKGCTSLTSVTIPESVTTINKSTFEGCTALQSVTIHAKVTKINDSAFSGCTGLTTLTFEGTKPPTLGNSVFLNCTNVTHVTVPKGSESNFSSCYIGDIKAYEIANMESVLPTDICWATGCLGYDALVPDGTTAYYVSAVSDGKIVLSEFPTINVRGDRVIPAKQGFIYNADANTHWFHRSSTTVTVNDNLLTGVYGSTATFDASSVYVLNKISDTAVGFLLYTGTSMTTNHAYLAKSKVTSSGTTAAKSLAFDIGGTTGITPTVVEAEQSADAIYNLQGQRVSTMQRGHIYIKGGKKILFVK